MRGTKRAGVTLQPRDRLLLDALETFRVFSRDQAAHVAGFSSVPRVNARLLALTQAGLLRRAFIGSAGHGRAAVYRLPRDRTRWSESFTQHQLAINDVRLSLSHGALPGGVRFVAWEAFRGPLSQAAAIIPDGLVRLTVNGVLKSFFVEVDMGSESGRIWRRKAEGYLAFALSGEFKQRFGVLVIGPTPRRVHSIADTIGRVTTKLFYLSDFISIRERGFFAPIWVRPGGEEQAPFI